MCDYDELLDDDLDALFKNTCQDCQFRVDSKCGHPQSRYFQEHTPDYGCCLYHQLKD